MTKSVLIVEDDLEIREILCELLADEGYRTVSAANGEEALSVLRERSEQVHVIVLDLMMPLMDGRQFRSAQLADARLAAIPVVLATAGADAATEAKHLGATAWLRKPFDLDDLLQAVNRAAEHG